jgi:hypothetical protein
MTLSDMANLGTLLSGITVALSLVYLARQLKQNARHQRGMVGHGRVEHVQQLIQSLSGSRAQMDIMLRGWAGDGDLDRVEFHQFYWSVFSIFVTFEDTYNQYQEGMICRTVYNSALKSMRHQLAYPGARAVWVIARESFEKGFAAFMDQRAREAASLPLTDRRRDWIELVPLFQNVGLIASTPSVAVVHSEGPNALQGHANVLS